MIITLESEKMKTKKIIFLLILVVSLSGCVVYSFYPIYTNKDLFPNDILTGEWSENEGTQVNNETYSSWSFKHPFKGKGKNVEIDSLSYILTLKTKEDSTVKSSEFIVHLIELDSVYLLDFYMENYMPNNENVSFASFHVIPVHTFAKLTVEKNKLTINWFDQDWLTDLINENKIRIKHENNGDIVLLTAQPDEMQKFVKKYINSPEAFEEGLSVELIRKK